MRRATHLRCSIAATSALYVPEQLHEIRIALKKLRYAEELRAEAGARPSPDLGLPGSPPSQPMYKKVRLQSLLRRLGDFSRNRHWSVPNGAIISAVGTGARCSEFPPLEGEGGAR